MANVPAAAACIALLKLLARHAEPMPAAAISRELGVPRSTVYHLLALLRDEGFVVHLEDERRYALGLSAFDLGSAYNRQAPMQRLARPFLARLVDRVGFTGHLGVLHGQDVLYLIEERAPGRPVLVTDVEVRLPAHLTASGLAMLAALTAAAGPRAVPDRRVPGGAARRRREDPRRVAAGAGRRPARRLRRRDRSGQRGCRQHRLRGDRPPGISAGRGCRHLPDG